eukprot:TRINITY_DN4689_c0_g1_i1.p1 TRINITY_DN4689_c0_g1~~TRINITY_DN4689_c0_g1_i1.p1  ORF type:complete len:1837 (+),score=393.89 TRINITY_DN4689_c0_g1_i1:87-5597(+)
MSLPEIGTFFWIQEDESCWYPYKLEEYDADYLYLTSAKGNEIKIELSKMSTLQTAHPSCLKGLDDMVHLGDLHEAGLLHTIRERFESDRIYTYTGAILVSVNPYQGLPIYSNEIMHTYRHQPIGSKPPHIFAIADNAYRSMCDHNQDQAVIISGESGAGKTEATKLILQYLAAVSGHHSWVEQQILDSSPVLEAFGNAKTIRNDNSSRFGKFIEIHFDEDNKICGASIINYLLEKSRLVFQATDERNYHIFYQLTSGASPEEKAKYHILPADEYRYLNQSGCYKVDKVNDSDEFTRVKMALSVLNMADEEIDAIFRILSGILMIGNVRFAASSDGESCTITNPEVANTAADILQTDPWLLALALTNRTNVIAGNAITVPLKESEAYEGRDAFVKSIYGRMFDWIVSRINDSIRQGKKKRIIGVLDIFGFEIFQQNSFEQFCINFANEKLQQHFNQFIFKAEQEEYEREKISWSTIDFVDNQECIDLVEKKPLGLVYLIDEICKAPKGGDQLMLEKFHKNHEKSPYYEKPRVSNGTFGIKHYAGPVTYAIDGFTEKNKDTLYFDYIEAMQASKSDHIRNLFPEDNPKMKEKDKKRTQPTKQTVAYYFKEQLTSLMATLQSTEPHFVRCLKPNTTKSPRKIDSEFLFRQLKYAGMIEAVRIRRLGYPVRRDPQEFINRFWMIGSRQSTDDMDLCQSILMNIDAPATTWQIGQTKVFMQEPTYLMLENKRSKMFKAAAQTIQGFWRSRKLSLYFKQLQKAVKLLQPRIRGWIAKRKYHAMLVERDQRIAKVESRSLGSEDRYCKAVWAELLRIERDQQALERQFMKSEEKFQREVLLELIKIEKIRQFNELKQMRQEEVYQIQVMIELENMRCLEIARREAEEKERQRVEAERLRAIQEAEDRAREQERLKKEEQAREAERIRIEVEQREKEAIEAKKREEEEKILAEASSKNMDVAQSANDAVDDLSELDDVLQGLIADANSQKESLEVLAPHQTGAFDHPIATHATAQHIEKPENEERTNDLPISNQTQPRSDNQVNSPIDEISVKVPSPALAPLEVLGATQEQIVLEEAVIVEPLKPSRSFKVEVKAVPQPSESTIQAPFNTLRNRLVSASVKADRDELDDLNSLLGQLADEKAAIDQKLADVTPEPVVEKQRRATVITPSGPITLMTSMSASITGSIVDTPYVMPEPGSYVRALFDFQSKESGFLSLCKGDVIAVIQADLGGWGRGECGNRVGWFPLEFVEEASEEEIPEDIPQTDEIPSGQTVMALFDFVGADASQLTFKKGDLITILENDESGWCQGMLSGVSGWFPYDYVEKCEEGVFESVAQTVATPPEKDEMDIYAEPCIEINLPRDIHKHTFEEYAKKHFSQQRTGTFRKKTIDAVDLTLFSKEPLKAPLLAGHAPESIEELLQVSHSIMKYMGDYSSKKDPVELMAHIVESGLQYELFRDEIYCNLCKQLSNNPNLESAKRGWEILSTCIGVFPPTKSFELALKNFLRQYSRISGEIGDYASICQRTLARVIVNGARSYPPTQDEYETLRQKKPVVVRIYFVDDEYKEVAIDQQTTCREVVMHLCKRLGIRAYPAFFVSERIEGEDNILKPQQVLMDTLAKWKFENLDGCKLIFKNHLYLKSFSESREEGLNDVLYKQAVISINQGVYTCTTDEALQLAALQCLAAIGNTKTSVAQYIGNQPEKVIPPEILPTKSKEEWIKIISAKVQDFVSSGKSYKNAKENYMAICKRWPKFGMSFYAMEQSVPVGDIPTKFILGVNYEGVHFIDSKSKETIKMLRYGDVTNWGFSASTFVIITGDLRSQHKYLLKTRQGTEISELVQAYINCIVD